MFTAPHFHEVIKCSWVPSPSSRFGADADGGPKADAFGCRCRSQVHGVELANRTGPFKTSNTKTNEDYANMRWPLPREYPQTSGKKYHVYQKDQITPQRFFTKYDRLFVVGSNLHAANLQKFSLETAFMHKSELPIAKQHKTTIYTYLHQHHKTLISYIYNYMYIYSSNTACSIMSNQ